MKRFLIIIMIICFTLSLGLFCACDGNIDFNGSVILGGGQDNADDGTTEGENNDTGNDDNTGDGGNASDGSSNNGEVDDGNDDGSNDNLGDGGNTNDGSSNNGVVDDGSDDGESGSDDGAGDNENGGNADDQTPAEPKDEVMFQGFRFNLKKDKTYELTYSGVTSSDITVPEEVEGVKVTSIGEGAFKSQYFKTILLPDSVTEIGYEAFAYNSLLNTINLGKVVIIGERAFMNCSSLKTADLSSVEQILDNAFVSCTLLGDLNMPNVKCIKESVFFKCNSMKNVVIGDKCIQIYGDAFYECSALTSITLGSSDGYWYYYLVRTDETGDQIRGENNTGSIAGFGEKLESPDTCATFLKSKMNAGVYIAQYEYFEVYCNLTFDPDLQQYQLPGKNMYK